MSFSDRDIAELLALHHNDIEDLKYQMKDAANSTTQYHAAANSAFVAPPTGSVQVGTRQYRTDLDHEYTFNGTYWLGPRQRITLGLNNSAVPPYPGSATAYPFRGPISQKCLVVAWGIAGTLATPNNGTSYWTIATFSNFAGLGTVFTYSTNTLAVGGFVQSGTCNFAVTSPDELVVSVTPVGAPIPGSLYVNVELIVREIQT